MTSNDPFKVAVSTVNVPPVLSVTAASFCKNDPAGCAVTADVYPLNGILSVKVPCKSITCKRFSIALIWAVVELFAPTTLSVIAQGPAVTLTSRYL